MTNSMDMPAISVVVPIYNAASFLDEALDSLLSQTCSDFEVIAVNDGSTDNSLEILQKYAAKDTRIRILDGPNGGYGKAMNRGMNAAKGKYMAILEPDDYLPNNAYATLLPIAEEQQLDVIRGSHCSFFEDGNKRNFIYRLPAYKVGEVFQPLDDIPGVFKCGPGIWCNLYNLDFLRKNNIRFHQSPGASYQDVGFFLLCAAYAKRYMLVADSVYMYRMDNPGSSVKAIESKWNLLLAEYDRARDILKDNDEVWSRASQALYWVFMGNMKWLLYQLSEKSKIDFAHELVSYLQRYLLDGNMLAETKQQMQEIVDKNFDDIQSMISAEQGNECVVTQKRKLFGMCWYSITMSAEFTERRILGISVMKRCKVPVWQCLSDNLKVANSARNIYYILGVPVWKTSCPPIACPQDKGCVPAIVTNI